MKRGLRALLLVGLGALLVSCDWLSVEPVLPPTAAPTGVTASFGTSQNSITISWNAVERATYYKVFRANAADGEYEELGPSSSTSFTDSVENQGTWYWYKVQACNSAGCGPESAPVRGYAGRPPKPENVQASDGTFLDKIVIGWDQVPGATSYDVFRDPSPQAGCQGLCYLGQSNTNSYEDKQARPGVKYQYAVRAWNDFGSSALSETDWGCLNPCPPLFSLDEE
ncbi:MAG: hypothetical protein NZ651_04420 [Candidatus Bipolaricaulota bacterium]|nr:hypothetical protein [Candidatus Bipolaricaulota bacterium]MDW8126996.1 hypothetical protein [Candidatus Bipolaricaulota bacterium]